MNNKAGISKGATVVIVFFLIGLSVLLLSRGDNDRSLDVETNENDGSIPQVTDVPPASLPDNLDELPAGLPVPKDHPLVQLVLNYDDGAIRYLFSGSVESYRTTKDALEITYADSSGIVPEALRITSATQISSYVRSSADKKFRSLTYTSLQSLLREGLKIELAVDYSMNTKTWSSVKEAYVSEGQ
ncbi:MAG: hypothetical protein G01um101448_488 [Parcubacteria group bacterium Gr01-1014_48]|nr:MAG: hypothetical protein Greene041614_807 [Parcubacteria group bacterium Greene0416_14]TSC73845.1 MAG: hypothetical protein G01um101448_488 [Parcubacteria group bacterium Gr01-1014_48]TSD00398.1 MAG: hypothetical protein Greene101415_856 [Parcubacteria group bacterium Greene1014_15]TSD07736.1 MAG: hypothetical protein Greene07144_768 [Parcubacteria group bacterium Greene0714_4]